MFKKTVSFILIFVLSIGVFSGIPVITAAEVSPENTDQTGTDFFDEDVSLNGLNSLGDMLASEYEAFAEQDEDEEDSEDPDSSCLLYDVAVEGFVATVDLDVDKEAVLVVSVFDDSGISFIGSGMRTVTPDDTYPEVQLELTQMPESFYTRVYLLDPLTNVPLCKQLESDYYTAEMQAFLKKNVDDFEEDKVLNLDEDEDNNFLVYNENTVILNTENGLNHLVSYDEEDNCYHFENIDDTFWQLGWGDVFSYSYGDELLLVKVGYIDINGSTADIYALDEEMEPEDVFDYIRIESVQGLSEGCLDESSVDKDLEYLGMEEELATTGAEAADSAKTGLKMIDFNQTHSISLNFKFKEKSTDGENSDPRPVGASVSGNISETFAVKLSCYYDEHFTQREIKFSFKLSKEIKLNIHLEFHAKKKWSLGNTEIPLIPGVVSVAFRPYFVIEGKVSADINGKLSGQSGFSLKNGKFTDEGKHYHFSADLSFEAEVFIGVSIDLAIDIASGVLEAKGEIKGGVTIKSSFTADTENIGDSVKEVHLCRRCISGEIFFSPEVSVSLVFLKNDALKFTFTIYKNDIKLSDFYYSLDNCQGGLTTCPNKLFRLDLTVLDDNNNPVKDVRQYRTKM